MLKYKIPQIVTLTQIIPAKNLLSRKKGSYGEDITRKNLLAILCKEVTELYTR